MAGVRVCVVWTWMRLACWTATNNNGSELSRKNLLDLPAQRICQFVQAFPYPHTHNHPFPVPLKHTTGAKGRLKGQREKLARSCWRSLTNEHASTVLHAHTGSQGMDSVVKGHVQSNLLALRCRTHVHQALLCQVCMCVVSGAAELPPVRSHQ